MEKRRQALAQEVSEQRKIKQAKFESAESRRLKMLQKFISLLFLSRKKKF